MGGGGGGGRFQRFTLFRYSYADADNLDGKLKQTSKYSSHSCMITSNHFKKNCPVEDNKR